MKIEIHEEKKGVKFGPTNLPRGSLFIWKDSLVVRTDEGCAFLDTGLTWATNVLIDCAGECRPFTGKATISNEATE